ncbi:MAG: adenylate/guanylate cyclase domain-containing protein [Mycobacterium sp.]
MSAVAACRTCGTEPLENARFCHGCGSPVDEVDTRAEYKQVTVLFADVVHSMDIAAAVGPERLREIMAELVNRCTAVVQRYGGTVDKFTGDGIMAVFGAPIALEDHAVRACLAAQGIQEATARLAAEAKDRDGIDLQLRVGLNSGEVIAGEIGSGALGYTTIGEQVGMAQRMESVAPPGEVMLSASTARLVEGTATLGDPELVQIKGADAPVPARRLLSVSDRDRSVAASQSALVGRRWEMSAAEGLLDRAVDGHGAVVTVVGSPGIGKSRLAREVAAIAAGRGVEVFSAYCESHAADIAFHVVARLLRAAFGVRGLDGGAARERVRSRVPEADAEDLLLFDDLLGIADPDVELPKIDPDARRRRLTALVNVASLAQKAPAVYIVEDAHWIDEVSESMLADFVTVIPQTPSLVLVTYRPEYQGALSRVAGAKTIALAPLSDPETAALVSQLLGPDPSVGALAIVIAERAAGNPFFVEEMVRDLAERCVLRGNRSAYVSTVDAAEVTVPATVQATIAARIDRLNPKAKRTLSAAAVIGAKFSRDLLETLGIDPVLEDLVGGELIDQIWFTRQSEYVFHHPLIRTVAYESQLKSDRAELHRRLAAAIQARDPTAIKQNAALIAEHLQAGGDLHVAHAWHMRAATWAANRDIAAAYLSWQRAAEVADALPAADPARTVMRIAPRAVLCANVVRVHASVAGRFEELRELCDEVGDEASLTIGMMGIVMDHLSHARVREASRVASEQMALVESIGNPLLTIALPLAAIEAKIYTLEPGAMGDVLRWSQNAIDLADGNPAFGWALAVALTERGTARWCVGSQGWRNDLDQAVALASKTDHPLAQALAVAIKYVNGIHTGVLLADEAALREIDEAVQLAERSSDDYALGLSRLTLGVALLQQDWPAERQRGLQVLAQVRDMCLHERLYLYMSELPAVEVWIAHEKARSGDPDGALPLMRKAVQDLLDMGNLGYGIASTGVLVETLLGRAEEGDVQEAQAAVDRLAAVPADEGLVTRDIWLLRLRALLAQARGDAAAYADLRDRYREMARSLGFEGHIAWAEAMP